MHKGYLTFQIDTIAKKILFVVSEVEDLVNGKLQFDNGVEVVPKSNRLVIFSKGLYHGVEEFEGVRTSININPWNTRLYHS